MPELPEVETIARRLREGVDQTPSLIGMTILNADVYWQRSIALPNPDAFIQQIQNRRIQQIDRRGKFLRIDLDQFTLLIHLRMSGDIWLEPPTAPPTAHHRLVLWLAEAQNAIPTIRFAFNDPRKFGRVWLTPHPEQILNGLGLEPLSEEFTPQRFYSMLHKKNRAIKPLLMDQTFLAGLGNIYTDEALHAACIHPLRSSHQLSEAEVQQLWESIRFVLHEGIRRNGASIDWVYRGGDFQNTFRVVQRKGLPCFRCGSLIQRMIVGQRSTYFCPQCQKISPSPLIKNL